MDDIYEYLKMDHRKAAKLFELFKSAKTERNQLETYMLIQKELLVHSEAEQKTFYHALRTHMESKDDVAHAQEEHDKIKEKMQEIARHKRVDATMIKAVMELKDLVEHHVNEEESTLFREAKQVFSNPEAIILKLQMHDLKEKLRNETEIKTEILEPA